MSSASGSDVAASNPGHGRAVCVGMPDARPSDLAGGGGGGVCLVCQMAQASMSVSVCPIHGGAGGGGDMMGIRAARDSKEKGSGEASGEGERPSQRPTVGPGSLDFSPSLGNIQFGSSPKDQTVNTRAAKRKLNLREDKGARKYRHMLRGKLPRLLWLQPALVRSMYLVRW